ncbi:MAG: immunoglobulin domain-containing protein [Bacteroidales bacterium]
MKFTYIIKVGLLAFVSTHLFAEGTKQIMPTSGSNGELQLMPSFSQFALYDCPADDRLYIHIKTVGEKICFGFGERRDNNGNVISDVQYRLRRPDGTIVMGPASLPTSGAGWISTYDQAVIGPNNLAGNTGGYIPLTHTATMTGDYYIEFNFNYSGWGTPDRCRFKYFDITVGNAANQEVDGRVWSKAWQFTSGNQSNEFLGKLFVYADDGIVTKIDFNGIQPYVFTVYCNINGITNTGVFEEDRKSRNGTSWSVIAQYKIFLNDPDITEYPTGSFGAITAPITTDSHCDGNLDIFVSVNKTGKVNIFFDINPAPGVQPEDVSLTANVNIGNNTITWDGINGLGQPVSSGTNITVTVTYINGLTNLPMRDPDTHPYGFIIDLIRPTGPRPAIFWDDSEVGGSVNLTGCTSTSGCHSFTYSVGNNNYINTWWYASSTTGDPVTVNYRRNYSGTTNDAICEGDSILINGAWVSTAGTYVSAFTNQQGCDSNVTTILTLKPRPIFNLGTDTVVCNGQAVQFNGPSGTGYTYLWKKDGVPFSNSQNVTVTQTGNYSLLVTAPNGCTHSDAVNYISHPIPGPLLIRHN